MKKLSYIAEFTLPSRSAYSIQVMKMCEAFSKKGFKVDLHVLDKKINKSVFSAYNCSNNFKIRSYGIKKNNFIGRLLYALKNLYNFNANKDERIFYCRSIITGLLLCFLTQNIVIELHHNLKGFTLILFNFCKKLKPFTKIKFVFITKNLQKFFDLNNKSIVLDDAVDIEKFVNHKSRKKFKNTCVYTGSFSKGKGLETIIKIAKVLPNITFHIYGDFTNSYVSKNYLDKIKNITYKGYVENREMPNILSRYYAYLMPYSKKVFVRSKNIEVGKYMSPLKLFEYLASEGVLFASEMQVYKHILNGRNSIIIKKNLLSSWKKKILSFFKKKSKFEYLSINAYKTAKENTWKKRVEKIKVFLNA
mgnify:CR=1 FL=1